MVAETEKCPLLDHELEDSLSKQEPHELAAWVEIPTARAGVDLRECNSMMDEGRSGHAMVMGRWLSRTAKNIEYRCGEVVKTLLFSREDFGSILSLPLHNTTLYDLWVVHLSRRVMLVLLTVDHMLHLFVNIFASSWTRPLHQTIVLATNTGSLPSVPNVQSFV